MVGGAEEAREMLLANHSIHFQTQNLGTLFSVACEKLLNPCPSPHLHQCGRDDKNVAPGQATSLGSEISRRTESRVSLPITLVFLPNLASVILYPITEQLRKVLS